MARVLRTWWIVAILVAGCTAQPAQDAPPGGTIAGVVVSQAIEPISGAQVRLQPAGFETTSDPFGRFRFDGLDPGLHEVAASATNHSTTAILLAIEPGETVRPRIVMPAVPTVLVRHETHEFQGFVPAWFGPLDEAMGPVRSALGPCTCAFTLGVPDGLTAITLEAVWQDSFQRQDAATNFQWNVSMNTSIQGAGPSPLHAHILGQHMDLNGTEITVSVVPDEEWPAYDQSYQLFVTLWQGEEPPAGWSRVRGDP